MLDFEWSSVSIEQRVQLSNPKEYFKRGPPLQPLNEEEGSSVRSGNKEK